MQKCAHLQQRALRAAAWRARSHQARAYQDKVIVRWAAGSVFVDVVEPVLHKVLPQRSVLPHGFVALLHAGQQMVREEMVPTCHEDNSVRAA